MTPIPKDRWYRTGNTIVAKCPMCDEPMMVYAGIIRGRKSVTFQRCSGADCPFDNKIELEGYGEDGGK